MPEHEHRFPLIDAGLNKPEIHGWLAREGVKRPAMYGEGFPNNNCVGCIRGGMGYWNLMRARYPEVFARRAAMERRIGASIINGIYLDELPLDAGRNKVIVPDCGIMCEFTRITYVAP